MAEKRISELTAKGSSLAANDLIEVSEYVSPGVYRTRYVTGTQVGAISSNFATADLTFTANRNHDFDGYDLTFTDVGDFRINGMVGVNTAPLSYTRMYINAGTGNYGIYVDASDELGGRFDSVSNRGILASSSSNRGIEATSTSSYGGHFKSQDNYAIWSQSTGAGTQYSILSNGQCDFKNYADTLTIMTLKNDGIINMPNLPTSSAGLSAGDVWNNSGVLTIV